MHELNEAIWHCHFKTNRRLKRHLQTTTSQQHGQPAETKPTSTILTHGVKMGDILLDPKVYLKVQRLHHNFCIALIGLINFLRPSEVSSAVS